MQIVKLHYDTFDDFRNNVLPGSELGEELFEYNKFIFRGEATSTFKLIPSVLREGNTTTPHDSKGTLCKGNQIRHEFAILREFFKTCNENGLKLPSSPRFRRSYHDTWQADFVFQKENYFWLTEEFEEIAALAQHYGAHTRLLDWTSDPFVAMYFASIGAINRWHAGTYNPDDSLVIWALNAEYVHRRASYNDALPLKLVIPPYHDNPNLYAQKGVLSYWQIEMVGRTEENDDLKLKEPKHIIDNRPLNVLLEEYDEPSSGDQIEVLYKLTLPVAECYPMYKYLSYFGYNAAKLFPGYSGITQCMRENQLAECFHWTFPEDEL